MRPPVNDAPVVNRRRTIVGERAAVQNALRAAYDGGRLVQLHTAGLMPAPDERVYAVVTMAEIERYRPQPAPPAVKPRRRYWITGAVLVLAGLAWLIVVAVLALLAWITAHAVAIIGAAVALVILSALVHAPARSMGCCPCHRR